MLNTLILDSSDITDEQLLNTKTDAQAWIRDFLESETLKPFDNPRFRDQVQEAFQQEYLQVLIKHCYLKIVVLKFFPERLALRRAIKQQICQSYARLFADLKENKNEVIEILIFSTCYIVHHQIYLNLEQYRSKFDQRFVYDVYHILISGINGIFVTDSYVKLMTEKYFNKFLSYMNEKKEKAIKRFKKIERQPLFGSPILPDLTQRDGGQDFQKQLRETFRQKKKVTISKFIEKEQVPEPPPPPTDINMQRAASLHAVENKEILFGFQKLRFNMNSISPAVAEMLSMKSNQLQEERTKLVYHKMEKINERELEILKLLKSLSKQDNSKKEIKNQRTGRTNLIEAHDLSVPGKEFFQNHPRADPLMRDMLELKYVLSERRESMLSLPSSKDNQLQLLRMKENSQEKAQQYIQDRIAESAEKRSFFGKSSNDPVEASTAWNTLRSTVSPQNTYGSDTGRLPNPFIQTQIKDVKPKEGKLTVFQRLQKAKSQSEPRVKLFKEENQLADRKKELYDKRITEAFKQAQNPDENGKQYEYKDQRAQYHQQFDQLLSKESTESKINEIIQNIQQRQNLVGKQLMKKIHQM